MRIVSGEFYAGEIKQLIEEYMHTLNRDLCFQNIDEELRHFPRVYTGTKGKLLAAVTEDNHVAGCIAYSKKSGTQCEMKRLYVKPEYRKQKAGMLLVDAIIEEARKDGFQEMVLDTLLPMQSAIRLYQSAGFVEIPPYYDNPMNDVIYMKRTL